MTSGTMNSKCEFITGLLMLLQSFGLLNSTKERANQHSKCKDKQSHIVDSVDGGSSLTTPFKH